MSSSSNIFKMKRVFTTGLRYSVIITFDLLLIEVISLKQAQLCGGNSTTSQVTCPARSVISIVEDSLTICYKEYCDHDENLFGRVKNTLWKSCHGKEVCSVEENDIVASMCSSEGNVLDFTYNCIDLYQKQEANVQLGLVLGVIVCVVVCSLMWKNRKQGQADNLYSDTAFSPVNREPMETNHYTEIDMPTSSHYTNIDLPQPTSVRISQDNAIPPDLNVQYGKVKKPKKSDMLNEEDRKMFPGDGTGLTQAGEDETLMQENTDLYS